MEKCACTVERITEVISQIKFCPLHEAAPAMLYALQQAAARLRDIFNDRGIDSPAVRKLLKDTLAKTERG